LGNEVLNTNHALRLIYTSDFRVQFRIMLGQLLESNFFCF